MPRILLVSLGLLSMIGCGSDTSGTSRTSHVNPSNVFGSTSEHTHAINSSPSPHTSTSLPSDSVMEKYGLQWVKNPDGSDTIRADIWIAAPVDVVWNLVRDPNRYITWNKAINAQVDDVAPGQPILLSAQILPWPLPPIKSAERIGVVDDQLHAISWQRDFGLGMTTDRWQIVEPEDSGSRYSTALKQPFLIGAIVDVTLRKGIQKSFTEFAQALRTAAQRPCVEDTFK